MAHVRFARSRMTKPSQGLYIFHFGDRKFIDRFSSGWFFLHGSHLLLSFCCLFCSTLKACWWARSDGLELKWRIPKKAKRETCFRPSLKVESLSERMEQEVKQHGKPRSRFSRERDPIDGVPFVGLKQNLTPKILDIKVVPVGNLKDCYLPLFGGPMPWMKIAEASAKHPGSSTAASRWDFFQGNLGRIWRIGVSFESCRLCKQEAPLVVACVACDLAEASAISIYEKGWKVPELRLNTRTVPWVWGR